MMGLGNSISVPCIAFGLSLGPAPPGACNYCWHLYHIPDISNSLESLLKLDAHSHNVIHLHYRTFFLEDLTLSHMACHHYLLSGTLVQPLIPCNYCILVLENQRCMADV